jgi:hypothetical protein
MLRPVKRSDHSQQVSFVRQLCRLTKHMEARGYQTLLQLDKLFVQSAYGAIAIELGHALVF